MNQKNIKKNKALKKKFNLFNEKIKTNCIGKIE